MRITKMLLTLGLALLFAGCGAEDFLNPLYTKKDLVPDPLLAGTWEQKQDDGTLILEFQPAPGGCYTLNASRLSRDTGKPDEQETATACLVELGQARFLDFEPEHVEVESTAEEFHLVLPPPSGDESPFSPAVLHIHDGLFATLARAEGGTTDPQSAHELRLTPAHWIFKIYVDQATLRLNYFEPPGDVRTLSTEDFQRLALHYADDTNVFSSLSEWRRQTGGSQ